MYGRSRVAVEQAQVKQRGQEGRRLVHQAQQLQPPVLPFRRMRLAMVSVPAVVREWHSLPAVPCRRQERKKAPWVEYCAKVKAQVQRR